VMNNGALGWVMHGQGKRLIASELPDKNYAEIGKAMGCRGARIEKPGQLARALSEALKADEPTVLDVRTSLKVSFADVTSPLALP